MAWDDEDDSNVVSTAVVNDEEQYSTWPVDWELPPGWTRVGEVRSKKECLAWIDEVWTDQRPRSLRKQMEEAEAQRQAEQAGQGVTAEPGGA